MQLNKPKIMDFQLPRIRTNFNFQDLFLKIQPPTSLNKQNTCINLLVLLLNQKNNYYVAHEMIIASLKNEKIHRMSRKKTFSFIIHLNLLDNRHRCMRVIDANGIFVNLLPCGACLEVSSPNFIFSNFKFQVQIQLHNSCSQ